MSLAGGDSFQKSDRLGWAGVSTHAIVSLTVLALANFSHYATRNVTFPMNEALRHSFAVSNEAIGLMATGFILAQGVCTIPFGWAGDRWSRKWMLTAAMAGWTISTYWSYSATSFNALVASRVLAGIFTAACVPFANATLCQLFPKRTTARAISVLNLGLFFGSATGFVAGEKLGFPRGFFPLFWLGAACTLAVAVGLQETRQGAKARQAQPDKPIEPLAFSLTDLHRLTANRPYVLTILGALLMSFSAGGYTTWFRDFLLIKGFSSADMTQMFVVVLCAGFAGVVTGGIVADAWRRRRVSGRQRTMIIGMGCSALLASCIILSTSLSLIIVGSVALTYVISWYHAPLASSVDELVPISMQATGQAFYIAIMHIVGTAPSSWVVGRLSDQIGIVSAMWVPTIGMASAAAVFYWTSRSVEKNAPALGISL